MAGNCALLTRARRVLISGGSGFLGRAVIARLRQDEHTVTAIGRTDPGSQVDFIRCDLADPASVRKALNDWRWDGVIHLAAVIPSPTIPDSFGLCRANVLFTENLLNALPPAWSGPFILASSMRVYGEAVGLVAEQTPLEPNDAYGTSKAVSEALLLSRDAIRPIVLRFPGLFGVSRGTGAVAQFVRRAAEGQDLDLTDAARVPWDLLDVEDAADAVHSALNSSIPRLIANIAYGNRTNLREVSEHIAKLAGVSVVDRNGAEFPWFGLDATLARTALNWSPPSLHARLEMNWKALTTS